MIVVKYPSTMINGYFVDYMFVPTYNAGTHNFSAQTSDTSSSKGMVGMDSAGDIIIPTSTLYHTKTQTNEKLHWKLNICWDSSTEIKIIQSNDLREP